MTVNEKYDAPKRKYQAKKKNDDRRSYGRPAKGLASYLTKELDDGTYCLKIVKAVISILKGERTIPSTMMLQIAARNLLLELEEIRVRFRRLELGKEQMVERGTGEWTDEENKLF